MAITADEYHLKYPFTRYRYLREEKADNPLMTLEKVKRF